MNRWRWKSFVVENGIMRPTTRFEHISGVVRGALHDAFRTRRVYVDSTGVYRERWSWLRWRWERR
jgi:hypothetical protein